ncbi:MAG: hypothetical protein ACO4CT_04085 [Planctomycetota bacterium]
MRVGAALALGLLSACAAHVPPVPLDAYQAGDMAPVRAYFDEQLKEGDPNSGALFLNGLALCELYAGEEDAARRHFETAGRVMGTWATGSGEVAGALIGSESSKTWKGDPHEKAMNSLYRGILHWMRGEPDNARAAFRRGILADAESDEGEAQVDFALLFWLAGRASLEMGLRGDAEGLFEEARQARKFAVSHGAAGHPTAPLLEDPSRGNLIVITESGLGPEKVAAGLHGSLAQLRPRPSQITGAEVFVDGKSVGRTTLLADLDYQASTRGGRVMEGIREGKAVFKEAAGVAGVVLLDSAINGGGDDLRGQAIVGGALLLASILTASRADTRHWATLPKHVHALVAEVPPGRHEVRIEFLGPSGVPVPRLTKVLFVDIVEGRDSLVAARGLPAAVATSPSARTDP